MDRLEVEGDVDDGSEHDEAHDESDRARHVEDPDPEQAEWNEGFSSASSLTKQKATTSAAARAPRPIISPDAQG